MAKSFKIPYPLVEVIWDDASSNSESWVHLDDVAVPERVNTTGFLVKETEHYITIAASVSAVEDYIETVGNTMTIPIGMIVSRREVRLVNVRSNTRYPVRSQPDPKEVYRKQGES